MNRLLQISLLLLLVCILMMIRYYEEALFYDPFISFFKSDYKNLSLPPFDTLKLIFNIALRYVLNTLLSLAILWIIFKDKGIIKFSLLLYSLVFVVLLGAFTYFIFNDNAQTYLSLFYIRRFLIQPLFILILLPAFYFQKKK